MSITARKDWNVIECVNCQACWNGWNELDSALADSEVIAFVARYSTSIFFFHQGTERGANVSANKGRILMSTVSVYFRLQKYKRRKRGTIHLELQIPRVNRLLSSMDITLELRWQHWKKAQWADISHKIKACATSPCLLTMTTNKLF